jgi:hypothetical protein
MFEPSLLASDYQCRQDFVETWKESAELSQKNPAVWLYEFELLLWESELSCLCKESISKNIDKS